MTQRYLSSPWCREELLLFSDSAAQLRVKELLLPVVVLGHRSISTDSSDPVAKVIAETQYRDFRDAALAGPDSATWRISMLELANDLVDAAEHAENRLDELHGQSDATTSGDAEPDDDELDEPGLWDIRDEALAAAKSVQIYSESYADLLNQMSSLIEEHAENFNAAPDPKKGRALLAFANAVKPVSEHSAQIAERLEAETVEADRLLRSAWRLAQRAGMGDLTQSLGASVARNTAGVSQLAQLDGAMEQMLQGLVVVEVLSVPLRKALRPFRNSLYKLRSVVGIVDSWNSIGNTQYGDLDIDIGKTS